MKRTVALITALFLLLVPARAQHKESPVVFTPQWTAQAQFAGYYVAQDMGFYREAGVDVVIVHPNASQSAEDRVRAHQSHATTLQLPQAMLIVGDGVPLVNVLQTSMNCGLMLISRREKNPMEQTGAKVGIWRAGYAQIAQCVARVAGLDYHWVNAASMVNLYIAGALDAMVAMSYNEYYQILQAGFAVKENQIYRFSENGFNIQGDGLYFTREYYNANRDKVERFAAASRRGWEYAVSHPEEALEIVMRYVRRNNIATNRTLQRLQLEEVLRLQLDPDTGERAFRLREDMVGLASDIMLRGGLITRPVTMEELCR